MNYECLTTRREGAVEYLWLNRPAVRNAFNPQLIAELTDWADATAHAARGHELRAAVMAGTGSVFCAGADAAWMAGTLAYTEAENVRDAVAMTTMFAALDTLPIPLVARVHGAAIGGGAGLVAVCDVVVAEEQALFGFTEVRLGLVPATIGPFVLRKIGPGAARELFLTGARFSAGRARELGLVHRVCAAGATDETIRDVVGEILSSGPEAVAAAKQLIRDVWQLAASETAERTARVIAGRRVSSEGQEGLKAFLEKRKPSWADGR